MIHQVSGDILLARAQGGRERPDDEIGGAAVPIFVYSEYRAGAQATEPGLE